MYEDYFVYIYNLNAMLKYVCSLICRRIYYDVFFGVQETWIFLW